MSYRRRTVVVGRRCGFRLRLPLHGGSSGCTTWRPVEQRLGRVAAHDRIGHRVGVMLEGIRRPAVHAALELHATTLLDDVRRLVRGRMHVRCMREPDRVSGRIRFRTERGARLGGRAADVRADLRDVVLAEAGLDRGRVRQRSSRSGDTTCCSGRLRHRSVRIGARWLRRGPRRFARGARRARQVDFVPASRISEELQQARAALGGEQRELLDNRIRRLEPLRVRPCHRIGAAAVALIRLQSSEASAKAPRERCALLRGELGELGAHGALLLREARPYSAEDGRSQRGVDRAVVLTSRPPGRRCTELRHGLFLFGKRFFGSGKAALRDLRSLVRVRLGSRDLSLRNVDRLANMLARRIPPRRFVGFFRGVHRDECTLHLIDRTRGDGDRGVGLLDRRHRAHRMGRRRGPWCVREVPPAISAAPCELAHAAGLSPSAPTWAPATGDRDPARPAISMVRPLLLRLT